MRPIILYDVAPTGERHCLPNPWATRMSLAHTGLPFLTKSLSLDELRGEGPGTLRDRMAKVLGPGQRPLVPMIDVPGPGDEEQDGSYTLVGDTITIAEYLDATFPDRPSLFLPASSTPPDTSSADYVQAHAMARLLKEGIGNSDALWSRHFELVSPELAESFERDEDRKYMKSDAKLDIVSGWQLFEAMDRASMLAQTRRSLLPFCALLSPQPSPRIVPPSSSSAPKLARPSPTTPTRLFLSSPTAPGLLDYILFGRYAMTRGASPQLNKAIWSADSDAARAWLASYRDGKWALRGDEAEAGRWLGDVRLDAIEGWVERMLDAHGAYARTFIDKNFPPA